MKGAVMNRIRHNQSQEKRQGFALIATIAVMVLLVMVALAMMSLSTIELRQSSHTSHQQRAKANARMALMIAIGELQKYAGPDQRVTANAAILDTNPETNAIEGVKNPNFLGVWKNTNDDGYPLVGSDSSQGGSSIYGTRDYYKDLRFSDNQYKDGEWKDELRLTWLASFEGDKKNAHQISLNSSDDDTITLLGKGTLGEKMFNSDKVRYDREHILVRKIKVDSGHAQGAYAWVVMENNQKASLVFPVGNSTDTVKLASAQHDKLEGLAKSTPLEHGAYLQIDSDIKSSGKAIVTYGNAPLSAKNTKDVSTALGADFNHFTTDASGLFTDPIYGGMKHDLTPLLFGDPSKSSIIFTSPAASTALNPFSSNYPIIPGPRHLSHGPSYDALRYWGKQKYVSGLSSGTISAETTAPLSSLRRRPTNKWRGDQNDGYTYRAKEWAANYPKLFPVMTDLRFHYYFGLNDASTNNRVRTHIIPRVCLWNPYNVSIKVSDLAVLMPNFFWSGGEFDFKLTASERDRVKLKFKSDVTLKEKWNGTIKMECSSANWKDENSQVGLFPNSRFLGFTLEATTMEPGECLVFSPAPKSGETSGGITIDRYNSKNISQNMLSASSPQGEDHYYHDSLRTPYYKYKNSNDKQVRVNFSTAYMNEIRLEEVERYDPWVVAYDNFNFSLKSSNGNGFSSRSAKQISESSQYPTLQLINGGNGGAHTYSFWYYTWWWGNSQNASGNQFGKLQTFADNPTKNAPDTHQIGSKLLWFDESSTEGNAPPLRVKKWASPDHIAFNPAIIANWNVRPQLSTRSPASIVAWEWYVTSSGAWLNSFSPAAPRDVFDMATTNSRGNYAKFPFGAASNFPGIQAAAMFDLPNPDYGALSIGKLRHAQLSPYSWHPTYIIGSSLVDLHAPYDATAYSVAAEDLSTNDVPSQWDLLIGGVQPGTFQYGPRTWMPLSNGLLQIGNLAENVSINQASVSTKEEMLAYDIVYETNQNIWDHCFISGLKLNSSGDQFVTNILDTNNLWNNRYTANQDTLTSKQTLNDMLTNSDGLSFAFWHAAYALKNKSAFNINSTSVTAWTAFLSGIRNIKRPLIDGGSSAGGDGLSVFGRLDTPSSSAKTSAANPDQKSAWGGARSLTDDELHDLADAIVKEVKSRGPFISLADMVNRRLMPISGSKHPDPAAKRGAIEAAILSLNLNSKFGKGKWQRTTNATNDNNKDEFKLDYDDRLDISKAWGAPGFLTQADILEPLSPAMTVRGDTFTIRCYGESKEGNTIIARAYLEAVVIRTPDYVNSDHVGKSKSANGNLPTDPAKRMDYATGQLTDGDLSPANKAYGRKYKIKSLRWLSPTEI